jgi:hypothetical protein
MIILPTIVEQSGPGIDLSSLPSGIPVEMSDLDPELRYARTMVTLVYDLSGFENVALAFDAREFGDEPHAPKDEEGRVKEEEGTVSGPVADFDSDGVAISDDRGRAMRGLGGRLARLPPRLVGGGDCRPIILERAVGEVAWASRP